ncbi:MAG: dephospho-CoA kinase [Gemmatimonadota bacterium]|nr:dephospho-CoA kinase [Gemmatimonadota bacterium]
MIRVGLTGTVAAGKSTVGDLFERWGASRVDADLLARQAVAPGSTGLSQVVRRFGESVLTADGRVDRKALRRVVFSDDRAREDLEAIVHAEVRRLRAEWRDGEEAGGLAVLVEEIPLLFETGLTGDYDVIVVVDAPAADRRERAMQARDWTPEEFDAIDGAQLDADTKRDLADYVIWNDGGRDELEEAARRVWEAIDGAAADGNLARTQD